MSLRSEAVAKAKELGLCTQCLKNKAMAERMQCERCIETNKRKRERRKKKYDAYQAQNHDRRNLNNKYRKKMIAYAIEQNICTKCFGRPAKELKQCDICLERKRRWALKAKKKKPTREEVRAKQKEYRKKALYNKVRKLDRIRYAVEKGGEL
jgi:hypothetical protein